MQIQNKINRFDWGKIAYRSAYIWLFIYAYVNYSICTKTNNFKQRLAILIHANRHFKIIEENNLILIRFTYRYKLIHCVIFFSSGSISSHYLFFRLSYLHALCLHLHVYPIISIYRVNLRFLGMLTHSLSKFIFNTILTTNCILFGRIWSGEADYL